MPLRATADISRHVVVIVWDGMRPDFITPEYAPTLSGLASNGVFFANHHAVYCSATEVNGTAIATGAYPNHSGIIANKLYLPDINSNQPVSVELPEIMAQGDKLTCGMFITCPTVAETLQAAGKTTAIAGVKMIALMHDRQGRTQPGASPCVFEGRAMPPASYTTITNRLGAFPPRIGTEPNTPRDEWTRRALTDVLWSNGVPAFSLLWLSEPDAAQHTNGVGSAKALAAIKSSDQQLAAVLAELDRHQVRDQTDVFVVSDHGFSTMNHPVEITNVLQEAGFKAFREFKKPAQPGDILVVSQGGSDLYYVTGRDRKVTRRLVQFLQQQEFSGVIFTREKLPGTFPLSAANINRVDHAPDVVLSMRWSAERNTNGVPGCFFSDSGNESLGAHASLSRFDLHNTLVAAGPDFKRGFTDELPTGNTDLVPTILHLLNVKSRTRVDGRVLSEALTVKAPKTGNPAAGRREASTTNGAVVWRQYLQTTRVNHTVYFDEGNGASSAQ